MREASGRTGTRRLVLRVTLKDCEVQHFRAGGKGGQNQNKRSTGARVIHHPSGARGEARDERSQLQNTRLAFRRMAESATFRAWVRMEGGRREAIEAEVERAMDPRHIRVEVRRDGLWHPEA
jgi:protein subunit release factor B